MFTTRSTPSNTLPRSKCRHSKSAQEHNKKNTFYFSVRNLIVDVIIRKAFFSKQIKIVIIILFLYSRHLVSAAVAIFLSIMYLNKRQWRVIIIIINQCEEK